MKPQHFSALLFLAALYWMYQLYQPFLLSITIATLLAMSTANIQHRLELLTRSPLAAALLSTLLLALLLFAPLGYFLGALTIKLNSIEPEQLTAFFNSVGHWIENAPKIMTPIAPQLEQWFNELNLNTLASKALSMAGTVGSYSASFLKSALLIIVFYFFAQYHGRAILTFVRKIVQLPQQDTAVLGFELTSVMGVVFYSIITTAMFEGALFGIAVAFMGYNGLLFGIMYGFASLIPIVGGALMWVPFMLFEFYRGHTGGAIFIALYSVIVISVFADTFVKPLIIKQINLRIVKSEAKMNELLIFFAIIAGLSTFGFWGMILGPAITAFFMSLIRLIERHQTIYAEPDSKSSG